MVRPASKNPNWKGGVCSFRSAEELFESSDELKAEILKRLKARFVVAPNGCWNWKGPIFQSNGRACLYCGSRQLAARLMYCLVNGNPNGLKVLHSCDNVLCINPSHLFLGTNADNSKDMVLKGRSARGEKNAAAVLTENDVLKIKEALQSGKTRYRVAKDFNVSWFTVHRIFCGKGWTYLD